MHQGLPSFPRPRHPHQRIQYPRIANTMSACFTHRDPRAWHSMPMCLIISSIIWLACDLLRHFVQFYRGVAMQTPVKTLLMLVLANLATFATAAPMFTFQQVA